MSRRLSSLRQTAYRHLHALSLTTRLVTVGVLMVLVAYVVTTSLTTVLLRTYLTERLDSDLEQYMASGGRTAGSTVLEDELTRQDTTRMPPSNYYVFLTPRAEQSQIYVWIPPSTEDAPPFLGRVEWEDPRIDEGAFTVDTGNERWRVLTARRVDQTATVSVALPMTSVDNTVRQLWVLTSVIGLVTLAIVAIVGWMAVRRAFRPLRRIEDTAAAIAAGDLTRRVPRPGADDEVASLSESLNAMLARIEQAFAVRQASERRMQQFVADASHELRTPLATVRGYAELYRVGGVREPEDVANAMGRIESEATRMTRLVEDLLLLTRWDSGPDLQRHPVDLTVLVSDVVQDARVRVPGRQVRMMPLGGPGGRTPLTLGDDGALRQVLTNLVANAVTYTPPDSPVDLALGVQQDWCVLEVRDHGEGLDPATAERIFERFYRADASRSRESGGTGLGLAIVATIVGRHGGTVRHRPTPGGGATFRVELPWHPGPPEAPDPTQTQDPSA